ncbi:MAG: energy transducer TonB [Pseudomonadota bacterium]
MALIAAIMGQYKEYPRPAQNARMEGTGELFFVLDHSGDIVSRELRKSSGHELLDKEILDLLDRVGQFPRFPEGIDAPRLEIVVPIQFSL